MPAAGPPGPGRAPAAPASVAVADASHEPDEATEPGEPDHAPPEPLPPDPEPRPAQITALTREAVSGACALEAPVVVDTAPRGRFLPVALAARPEGALVAWTAPDRHVRVRPLDSDGVPRGEVVDTGLEGPTDRYAGEARDAGFWLLAAGGGFVVATHRRASSRTPHVLTARALDADGRPRGEALALTTARLAHVDEVHWAPAPDGLWLLRPPSSTLTSIRVTDAGLEATDVTHTDGTVPRELAGSGGSVTALLGRRGGGVAIRRGAELAADVAGWSRIRRVLAIAPADDGLALLVRVSDGRGWRATHAATIAEGRFTLGARIGREDALPAPFAASFEPAFEGHPGELYRYPAPLARTLVIVDAARRRVRPPIPITPDDMAFEVAAVWTGRAVLVASGFLREIVVQRLGCAP